MSTKFTITLALAAGFIGGFASRYSTPAPVLAQTLVIPEESRAHKFVLVDENGTSRGVFGIESNGAPEIEITDPKGHQIGVVEFKGWSAVHGLFAGSVSTGPKKPTLLPLKP